MKLSANQFLKSCLVVALVTPIIALVMFEYYFDLNTG